MPTKRAREPAARTAWNSSSASRQDRHARRRARVRRRGAASAAGAGCRATAPARRRRSRPSARIAQRRRPPAAAAARAPRHCRPRRPPRRPSPPARAPPAGRSPSPTTAKRIAGEQVGGKRAHRIFNVARPTRARIIEMIQKRMTMVGSAQPFFSKWWCSGAIRNTRCAGALVPEHLDDDRHGLHHEQAADDHQHDLVLGGDRHRAQRAAQRQRADIAHEHRGGRGVEPQEAQPGADQRRAEHRQLADARHAG